MADLKNIFSSTIGKLVDKAKDVVDSGSVREIYEQGTTRAKSYGRIAKLTLELTSDNEELKRIYTEIGKLYYEQAKDSPEGYFAPLFAQAEDLNAVVAAKEAEISELKAAMSADDADIDVEISEFEEVVEETEICCEEPAPVEEEAVEECSCDEASPVEEKTEE